MIKSKQPQPKQSQPAKAKSAVWSREKSASLRNAAKLRPRGDCNCDCGK